MELSKLSNFQGKLGEMGEEAGKFLTQFKLELFDFQKKKPARKKAGERWGAKAKIKLKKFKIKIKSV